MIARLLAMIDDRLMVFCLTHTFAKLHSSSFFKPGEDLGREVGNKQQNCTDDDKNVRGRYMTEER
jgi:hypothetical protein